ncbi:peptide/nickel transport system substrate-binding protein [Frondihabitans sp. PhB188]|uniref:ABC transporter family substrate-binding protein n=1 Tax=Frondihabitans sp. PhB188 TaxID=2485200 RepID=UPI000F470E51|nr:ABC transporter family substrate-binding protein [Frondihabitans sp. PhB188]ROQ38459.1 peptide/nickel transport system substrate-binding protein [Frondihabitans sp. PhB188]
MKLKKSAVFAAGAVAVALVLTGCSGGGGDTKSTSDGKQTLSSSGDQNIQPASALKDGGTLRVPLSSFPANWNYGEVDGTLQDAFDVMKTMMLSPYTINAKGEPTLDTDLVSSVDVKDDPLTITYNINDKAQWSDGTPITWKDFEANWKALNGKDSKYQIADPTGYNQMKSVTQGTSAKQAIVTYSTPFADWKSMFNYLYPASVISTADGFNTGYLNKIPVTSGPFKLSKIDKTAQTVTVVRDDSWWGDKPKLDSVTFRALDSDADIDAYLNNEIDVVSAATSDRYDRVKKAKNSVLRAAPSANFFHIDMSSSGILKDKQLRLAVQSTINREAIAGVIYGTLPYKVSLLNNHIFLSTDAGYKDEAGDYGKSDPDSAKKILDADGWKTGSGSVREKGGKQLTMAVTIPAGVPTSSQIAQIVQSELADVGIKLTINTVPVDTFFSDYITPGKYDLTMFSWGGTGYHAAGVSIYTSAKQGQNYGRVSDSAVDKLLASAITEPDTTKSNQDYNDADKLIWEEGHSLPITQQPRVIASSPKLANYGARPGATDLDWTKIGFEK